MKKLIPVFLLLMIISCSTNTHIKLVQENHKNEWIEKNHVYRSLASIHNEKKKKE